MKSSAQKFCCLETKVTTEQEQPIQPAPSLLQERSLCKTQHLH